MIVLDTSGLLAVYHSTDIHHVGASAVLLREERLILSPFVLAELDYLVTRKVGPAAARDVLEDVAQGAFELESFSASDVAVADSIIDRYAGLKVGLTDASIVVLAERCGCYDILTLDQRHFRAMKSPSGKPFRLLPLDDDTSA